MSALAKGKTPVDIFGPELPRPIPVFVYGTLRKGHGNWKRLFEHDAVDEHLDATTKGDIYNVAGNDPIYPVAFFGGDNTITGDIFWFEEVTSALFGAHRMELGAGYEAVMIDVVTADGDEVRCLAWEYAGSRRRMGIHIRSGDWNEFDRDGRIDI